MLTSGSINKALRFLSLVAFGHGEKTKSSREESEKAGTKSSSLALCNGGVVVRIAYLYVSDIKVCMYILYVYMPRERERAREIEGILCEICGEIGILPLCIGWLCCIYISWRGRI